MYVYVYVYVYVGLPISQIIVEIGVGVGIGIGIGIDGKRTPAWNNRAQMSTTPPPPKRPIAHTTSSKAPPTADLRPRLMPLASGRSNPAAVHEIRGENLLLTHRRPSEYLRQRRAVHPAGNLVAYVQEDSPKSTPVLLRTRLVL